MTIQRWNARDVAYNLGNSADTLRGDALIAFRQHFDEATGRTVDAKLGESVSVEDFGAVGDGATDDTTAIQMALNAANAAGGGIVTAWGKYLITSITVPIGVTLLGNNCMGLMHQSGVIYGSHFVIRQSTTTAVTLNRGARLIGFAFHYPNQPVTSGTPTLIAYPWTITCTSGNYVKDVWCSGAYDFIKGATLSTFDSIGGYPIRGGIKIQQSGDVIRINNVHFNPNFLVAATTVPGAFYSYCAKNNESYAIWLEGATDAGAYATVDGVLATNIFSFCQTYGILAGQVDSPGDGEWGLKLTNFGFDQCRKGFSFGGYPHGFGCMVANGWVTPNLGPDNTLRSGIHFRGQTSDSGGIYHFENVNFFGTGDSNVGNDTGKAQYYITGENQPYQSSLYMKNCCFRHYTGTTFYDFSTFLDCRLSIEGEHIPHTVTGTFPIYRNTQPFFYSNQKQRTTAPSAGRWVQGDLVWNSEPSTGETVGWMCVTAGTPGTWKSFGDVGGGGSLGVSADEDVSTSREITTSGRRLINITNSSGNNTITLAAPSGIDGHVLVIYIEAVTAGSILLQDIGSARLSADWTPDATDTLTLVARGSLWIELSRTAN